MNRGNSPNSRKCSSWGLEGWNGESGRDGNELRNAGEITSQFCPAIITAERNGYNEVAEVIFRVPKRPIGRVDWRDQAGERCAQMAPVL